MYANRVHSAYHLYQARYQAKGGELSRAASDRTVAQTSERWAALSLATIFSARASGSPFGEPRLTQTVLQPSIFLRMIPCPPELR